MFLDSSAILALLLEEPDAADLAARIEETGTGLASSPLVAVESALNLARIRNVPISVAYEVVMEFLDTLRVEVIPIGPEIGMQAMQAYAAFGKGTGHPARLNLIDAFSYACAKVRDVPLLYKGEDFSRTDLG